MGAFLDNEEALNNVLPETVTKSMNKLAVGAGLIRFIYKMLSDKIVVAEWGGVSLRRQVGRGFPRGGALSLFL